MVSQREKFSSSVANAIDSYFCGLAEAQAFCTCVSEESSGRLEVTVWRQRERNPCFSCGCGPLSLCAIRGAVRMKSGKSVDFC